MKRILLYSLCAILIPGVFLCGMVLGIRNSNRQGCEVFEQMQETGSPIEDFRSERQMTRQMQVSQLNDLMYSADTQDDVMQLARQRLLQLMDWTEKETTVEGVLRLRGFEDVVATVHEDSVNVLVKSDLLTQQQTSIILEIVMRETGISGGNVKIIPIN